MSFFYHCIFCFYFFHYFFCQSAPSASLILFFNFTHYYFYVSYCQYFCSIFILESFFLIMKIYYFSPLSRLRTYAHIFYYKGQIDDSQKQAFQYFSLLSIILCCFQHFFYNFALFLPEVTKFCYPCHFPY